MKSMILEYVKRDIYWIKVVSHTSLIPLALFLTIDYRASPDYFAEWFFSEKIDTGGDSCWIKKEENNIAITAHFGCEEAFVTSKLRFQDFLSEWDDLIEKMPEKIIISQDGNNLILNS